jgi:tRNA (guanine37-N1)-methyltransferase
MVLKPEPIYDCFQSLGITPKPERDTTKESVVLLSAQGKPYTQAVAQELSRTERVVFLCGRYEGIDERINDLLCDRELSIGDYVLSGGELAAAVILDSVVRLLPGVLGNPDSIRFESFGAEAEPGKAGSPRDSLQIGPDGVPSSTHLSGGLLDYPHYTRPAEFLGVPIPEVLMGGNHDSIRQWRRRMALEKTRRNRPDLLAHAVLTREDREFLRRLDAQEP